MSEVTKKIYCGNGKDRETKVGKMVSLSINLDKIPAEFIKAGKNGGRFVNIDCWPNKDGEDQYGNAYALSVNTYKKEEATGITDAYQAKKAAVKPPVKEEAENELPF